MLRVRTGRRDRVAVEERTTVERREEPLVRIDDERVGRFDPVEEVAHARRGEGRPAIRPVDMQPHILGSSNRGDTGELVDEPEVRGATGRRDREHDPFGRDGHVGDQPGVAVDVADGNPVGAGRENGRAKVISAQTTCRVRRNLDDPDVHHTRCGRDRTVRPGSDHHVPPGRRLAPRPLGDIARRDESAEVSGRPAADEDPACCRRKSGEIGDPPHRLVLRPHRSRALHPRAGVDRGRPDHQVEEHRGFRRSRRYERHRPRMILADRGRREMLAEHPQRLHPPEPVSCDCGTQPVQVGRRTRTVERGWVETDSVERVVDNGLRQSLGVRVVSVHPRRITRIRIGVVARTVTTGQGHRFFQTGGRFSRKLAMPSCPSGPAALAAMTSMA